MNVFFIPVISYSHITGVKSIPCYLYIVHNSQKKSEVNEGEVLRNERGLLDQLLGVENVSYFRVILQLSEGKVKYCLSGKYLRHHIITWLLLLSACVFMWHSSNIMRAFISNNCIYFVQGSIKIQFKTLMAALCCCRCGGMSGLPRVSHVARRSGVATASRICNNTC